MIARFVITIVLLIGCVMGFIFAIREEESGWAFLLGTCVFIEGLLLAVLIDAAKRGNRETAVYSFPAETYKFEMVVSETITSNGSTDTVTKKDTTYVLTGIEPIMSNSKDEKEMKLKTRTAE